MQSSTLTYLTSLAAFTGVVHTLLGPDHYVPFIAMARAGRWSLGKTLAITVACGVGHVVGSVLLGVVGIAIGLAVGGLEAFETTRADVAAWLLIGFGLAYAVWGIHRAVRNRPHTHWHTHADGTVHRHTHVHINDHAHVHRPVGLVRGGWHVRLTGGHDPQRAPACPLASGHATPGGATMTGWVLFTIFVFGPCETLIPQLMYPAAQGSWGGLLVVVAVFALATIGTMTLTVAAGYVGLARVAMPHFQRYAHAVAGLALTVCGAAIKFGL